jgi:hypothetical protein
MHDQAMASHLPMVGTGANNAIFLRMSSGEVSHIISPWSDCHNPLRLDRVMDGGWLYYAAYHSPTNDQIELCFVSIYNLAKHVAWSLSLSGHYLGQCSYSVDLDSLYLQSRALIHYSPAPFFAKQVCRHHSDLAIYQFYKYIVGSDAAADSFLQSYIPESEPTLAEHRGGAAVHLLVIYNHNYSRNVPRIDAMYLHRFFSILHVLPNVAPPHPRCLSVPYGSYSYHVAVREGLKEIGRNLVNADDIVLVVQDDVMLHPRVCQQMILDDLIADGDCCAHPSRLVIQNVPDDAWAWNERITQSCTRPTDALVGSGFESMPLFFDPQLLYRGVSDVFALKCSLIADFLEFLGLYISRSVFPEASIPTALKLLCRKRGEGCSSFDGIYLWGAARSSVEDDDWVRENLIDSSNLFLHPVKIARQGDFS